MTTSIMALTDGLLDLIPQPAKGWSVYRQTAPKPTDNPPIPSTCWRTIS